MKKLLLLLLIAAFPALAQNDYTTTPNLGLKLPNYGSTNWGTYYNGDFTTLDSIVGIYHGGYFVVPFSTNPTFNLANGNMQMITLSANVTSSSMVQLGVTSGQLFYFIVCQNSSGGFTFSYPPSFQSSPTVAIGASTCTSTAWIWITSLNQWVNVGSSTSGGGGGGTPVTLQTNGINNASQSVLNFTTSSINAAGLMITPVNTGGNETLEASGTVTPNSGGTGRALLAANSVILGEGLTPVNFAIPGSAGTCLVSNGTTSDPSFQSCPTPSGISLPVTVTGTANSGGILYFNSTVQASSSGTLGSGQFVLGGGAGGAPSTSFSVVPAANGGTGVASPAVHQIPASEGSSVFNFITPGTAGGCFISNGTSADPSFQPCPSGSAVGAVNSIQYAAGAGAFAGLAPQSTNGVYTVIENVTTNTAVAPTLALPGVLTNAQTGTSYTYGGAFTNADRFGYTSFSNSSAVAVTLPQAGSTGFTSNWGNFSCNINTGVVTITPTTSTISYLAGSTYTSAATSMPLNPNECVWIYSNNTNYFAIKILPAGSGTVTHSASALTAGRLIIGNGSADVTIGNLSGDVTTAGGTATTIAANAVTPTKIANSLSRRSCDIVIGDQSGVAVTNGQLGPQEHVCYVPAAATVVEVDIAADGGTPNVIVNNDHQGTDTSLLSGALATGASGAIACANVGGTTGLDGVTSCSATLQNTSIALGDYLELASGTAGGTAKLVTVHIIYSITGTN